jgi:serine/threonine-protein kinase
MAPDLKSQQMGRPSANCDDLPEGEIANLHIRARFCFSLGPVPKGETIVSLIQLPGLTRLIALILILPFFMIAAAIPASSQSSDTYGAIFFDEDERVFGFSQDHSDRGQAESVAKRSCETRGGRKCIFAVVFEANQCGALADGDNDWAADYGSSGASARSNALSDCRKNSSGCKVIVAACNQPSSSPAPQVCREGCLEYDLQEELKYIGCYTGGLDGVWGSGSQKALRRFCDSGGTCLNHNQPTQEALEAARNEKKGFCKPVRRSGRCDPGKVFLEGQCIRKSEVRSFCGPGFERSGTKCVPMKDHCTDDQMNSCNRAVFENCDRFQSKKKYQSCEAATEAACARRMGCLPSR